MECEQQTLLVQGEPIPHLKHEEISKYVPVPELDALLS